MQVHLLEQLKQFPTPKRYIVALSGGCDSVALLHALHQLQPELSCQSICAVHINHGLQTASADWAAHCEQLCQQLAVPFHLIELKLTIPKGESLEAVARHARYAAFADYLQDGDMLLLAHHRDDQAETLLLQILRGSGVTGMASMPVITEKGATWLARPLLNLGRDEIEDYARQRHLHWIDDPSNQDTRFDRNFLRHDIFPLLKARWPAVDKTLARVALHQAEAQQLLNEMAHSDWLTCVATDQRHLQVRNLQSLSATRIRNMLRYWIAQVCQLPMPDTIHLQRILDEVLPAAEDATPLVQWAGVQCRRYRDVLFLERASEAHDVSWQHDWDLQSPLVLPTGETLVTRRVEGRGLRLEQGAASVSVQYRRGGERCRLPGRTHHNELKKLFQHWGVPPWQRDRVPLIFIGQELAQVVGFSLCEPYLAVSGQFGVEIDIQP